MGTGDRVVEVGWHPASCPSEDLASSWVTLLLHALGPSVQRQFTGILPSPLPFPGRFFSRSKEETCQFVGTQ